MKDNPYESSNVQEKLVRKDETLAKKTTSYLFLAISILLSGIYVLVFTLTAFEIHFTGKELVIDPSLASMFLLLIMAPFFGMFSAMLAGHRGTIPIILHIALGTISGISIIYWMQL